MSDKIKETAPQCGDLLDLPEHVVGEIVDGDLFLWIVDPVAKTLESFVLHDGSWKLESAHGGDEIVRAVPFDAIELDLSVLWLE
ncbi:MAG TPA: hypothetical protein VMT00_02455 [Thermoanaerobaculia bacterium]|nr:hypothetical protein [Thermoanaerobaculia bacterium]